MNLVVKKGRLNLVTKLSVEIGWLPTWCSIVL